LETDALPIELLAYKFARYAQAKDNETRFEAFNQILL